MNQIGIEVAGIDGWLVAYFPGRYNQTLHLWLLLDNVLSLEINVLMRLWRSIDHRLKHLLLVRELLGFNLIKKIAKLCLHSISFTLRVQSNGVRTEARTIFSFETGHNRCVTYSWVFTVIHEGL